jgi:hypothetical protein
MTSPDLINELQASRPYAPDSLRARVRELAAPELPPARRWLPLTLRRPAFVLVPAAAALAIAIGAAGVVGIAGSGGSDHVAEARQLKSVLDSQEASKGRVFAPTTTTEAQAASPQALTKGDAAAPATVGPTTGRAQRVAATLTVRVANSDRVSKAAQDALDLTRSLGGHVLTANVTTGDEASALLTVRIPVAKTQDAIARLSALGTIVSQQVSIEDLQERLDALTRRARSVRAQIVKITARLDAETLDPETRAVLELRRRTLRTELRNLRSDTAATTSEARFATVQLTVVTPASEGVVSTSSRLDRSLDKALEVLVWEGIVALVALLVVAPLAILAVAAWLLRRLYRRREEDRLLAAS